MGKKNVYNAYCPILGLADYGDSIDEVIKNIKSLMRFHIESLLADGIEVPTENTEQEILTSTKVLIRDVGSNFQVVVG